MWQRFTERSRRLIFHAQEEAGRLGENYVSTEHLLLGLIREDDSVASRVLDRMGISLSRIRAEIETQVNRADGRLGQDMQLTPRAKRVIDLAYDEARQFKNDYIGTEHLLLGMIREGEGLAGRILSKLGVELDRTRNEVLLLQDNTEGIVFDSPDVSPNPIVQARLIFQSNNQGLAGASLLSMADLSPQNILTILTVAAGIEAGHKNKLQPIRWQSPRSLAMIFEKPSLRTRVTFDLGMQQMGGVAITLGPQEIGLGTRESIPDVGRNLERWCDAVMARVFEHSKLETLRDNCKIPIINGLSDREHPCQCLTDLFTIQQKKGKLEGLKLAYVGDGNNMLHSLLLGCAQVGLSVTAACPPGYEPDPAIVQRARELADESDQNPKSKIEIVAQPEEAAMDADVVYTDVWTSMGQEEEQLARIQAFRRYQVNSELMSIAKPDAIFMHCLPAHRGDEVTDEVVDGPQSVVFDQAENRLHAQKAVLALLIGA